MSPVQFVVVALNVAAFLGMVTAFVVTGRKEMAETIPQGDMDYPPLVTEGRD